MASLSFSDISILYNDNFKNKYNFSGIKIVYVGMFKTDINKKTVPTDFDLIRLGVNEFESQQVCETHVLMWEVSYSTTLHVEWSGI